MGGSQYLWNTPKAATKIFGFSFSNALKTKVCKVASRITFQAPFNNSWLLKEQTLFHFFICVPFSKIQIDVSRNLIAHMWLNNYLYIKHEKETQFSNDEHNFGNET